MLRDNKNEARQIDFGGALVATAHSREGRERIAGTWRDLGLPAKLLMLTAVFVLLAEVLIFLPSVSTSALIG